jgi:hypothetical protein
MSVAIAHRPHVPVPWLPVIVVLAIAAAVVLVVALTMDASTTSPSGTSVQALEEAGPPAAPPDLPKNRSPVARAIVLGELPATAPAEALAPLHKSSRTPWFAGGGR